jgi:hypothetical protein
MMHIIQQQQHQMQHQQDVPAPTKLVPTVSPRPTMAALRPGMGPDDKVVNTKMYANDVLKDIAAILAAADEEEKEEKHVLQYIPESTRSTLLFEPYTFEDDEEAEEEEEPTKMDVANTWYEVGMETGVPGLSEIMPGFFWDDYTEVTKYKEEPIFINKGSANLI